jgi:hypothetical protein
VVGDRDELLATFCGRLEDRSQEKSPSLFWPLRITDHSPHAETPGAYLHPERFDGAAVHVGGTVLELRQGRVMLNLRRL